MKILMLLSLFCSSLAFANNGRIDYCNCYHKDGSGDLVQFLRNGTGQIKGAQIYSTGKPALSYSVTKDPGIIRKTYKGSRPVSAVNSAELILIARNPSNGRERHLIIFRDRAGALVSISDNWGGNISNCEGSATGMKSFCAANDGSIIEQAK